MELEIIRAIQKLSSPFADMFFTALTMMGEDLFVVGICSWIYWCKDKIKGKYIAYSLFTSMMVNNIVKDIFKLPRPIGEVGIISKRVETATGYSFPSGHTQVTTSLWTSLSILKDKLWLYVISVIVVLLVGTSRLYLGVHYPKDVLAGIVLGVIIPLICGYIFEKFRNEFLVSIITLAILSFGFIFGASDDYCKVFGLFLGATIGFYMESKINFKIPETTGKKIFRFIVGIVLLAVIKLSLDMIMPDNKISHILRYCVIGTFGLGIYPLIFKKMRF